MVVPFGFSVGDFIDGIALIRDLVKSLEQGAGACAECRSLINELRNLKRALKTVSKLEVDGSLQKEKFALEQMAVQCQQTIEDFVKKNAKFTSTFGEGTQPSKWRFRLRSLQWALDKKDHVAVFRAQIMGHTLALQTSLTTFQMQVTSLECQRADLRHSKSASHHSISKETNSLVKVTMQNANDEAKRHNDLLQSFQQQTDALQKIMLQKFEEAKQVANTLLTLQQAWQAPSPQVLLQQPTILEDAHGRIFTIPTDFVNSWEAFEFVLLTQFEDVPGYRKVQRREYAIQDAQAGKDLDFEKAFPSVFLPGRKTTMSIYFPEQEKADGCPSCGSLNEDVVSSSREIQCSNEDCNQWYSRHTQSWSSSNIAPMEVEETPRSEVLKRKRPVEEEIQAELEEDRVHQFRRVRIIRLEQSRSRYIWSLRFYGGCRRITDTKTETVWFSIKTKFVLREVHFRA